MDLYGNWVVGVDSAVNCTDGVWKTFVGVVGLSHQGSNVRNEPQTTVLLPDMQ